MKSTEASYATSTPDISFEQRVIEADDRPEVVALLQRPLVIDPLRRPSISDLLDHPCFADSWDSATSSEPASE